LYWMLNKVYDNYGNYIEYYYKTEEGEIRIDKILYTGNHNTGTTPCNVVYFHYAKRQDVNNVYIENTQISSWSRLLLDKIEITTLDYNHFRSYELSYGYDLYSFLTQVQEIGAGGEKFNPIIF